ncbi:MAG: ornithine cyclodeaminase family protein [Chloroflexi bacterium]|nr:ornithine cyclodeaminase family protein [Chloroflexota bacterium]
MALYLTEADVMQLFTMEDALRVVEDAFRDWDQGLATNRPRQRIRIGRGHLQTMSAAYASKGVMGFKAYASGGRSGMLVNLYSAENGELLAIVEASYLGAVRTGAASGVATRYMARQDASVVGVIGTGNQARTQLAAVCAVRAIREVKAFSRTAGKREAFAREMAAALALPVRAVDSAEECARGSHIVVTITNSLGPVFQGEWLSEGTHVNAAGSNHWMRRELDEATIKRCAVIVADDVEDARIECGELIWAVERGAMRWEQVRELREIVSGRCPGRLNDQDITLFESQGLAIEDVAAAEHLYRVARKRGLGQGLPGSNT